MKELLGFIIGFVLMYLTFAFGQASFNVADWAESVRHTASVYAFIFGCVAAFLVCLFKEDK